MKNHYLLAGLGMLICSMSFAQSEPSKPSYEKQVYLNGDGDIFVQKQLPLYLKFSTTPDGKNYDLKSTKPEYGEPMYLDTEGPNYVRSRYAVDPETGRMAQPQQEVLYEINADGLPPRTTLKFNDAPRYASGGTTYFGKNLAFTLTSTDGVSGVKGTQYALGGGYDDYSSDVSVSKEGAQTVFYYAYDNVGNAEDARSYSFTVDLTPPKTQYEVVGINKNGDIIAPSTKVKLTSSDNLSGVRTTYYAWDGGTPRPYTGPVSMSGLGDGEHSIKYYAVDNVKNMEGGEGGASASAFKFYLDRIPPETSHQVKGDQHKGNYLYVSARTTISLSATDNKAGVKNIYYRIDGGERNTFSSDFKLPPNRGVHSVKYDANDLVENLSGNTYINVFMDVDAPETGIVYANPQFMDRDTLFITSKSQISLRMRDDASGVQNTKYDLDGTGYKTYNAFTIPNEGYHTINFKSTDNVNNEETEKKSSCYIDNTAPEIFVKFSIEPIGKKRDLPVYPNYTRMYVSATDKKVGTEAIYYSMDGAAQQLYSSPQTLDASEVSRFRRNKKYEVKVIAKDKLGNTSEKMVEFYVGKDAE